MERIRRFRISGIAAISAQHLSVYPSAVDVLVGKKSLFSDYWRSADSPASSLSQFSKK
jgi:hypothetical protein